MPVIDRLDLQQRQETDIPILTYLSIKTEVQKCILILFLAVSNKAEMQYSWKLILYLKAISKTNSLTAKIVMISRAILNNAVKYWFKNYELWFICDTNIKQITVMKKCKY